VKALSKPEAASAVRLLPGGGQGFARNGGGSHHSAPGRSAAVLVLNQLGTAVQGTP